MSSQNFGMIQSSLWDTHTLRCGIVLDAWLVPLPEDVLREMTIEQPLIFINSFQDFQWKENIKKMVDLKERRRNPCYLITLK